MPTDLCTPPTHISQTVSKCLQVSGAMHDYMAIQKEATRTAVRRKLEAVVKIDEAVQQGSNIKQAVHQVARECKGMRGMSAKNLKEYYRIWRRGGQKQDADGKKAGPHYDPRDPRIFIPRYRCAAEHATARNGDFRQFIHQYFADTCREDATGVALRERLLDYWFEGGEVPGYGTIYQWCGAQGRAVPDLTNPLTRARSHNIPEGWSADNLRRLLPKSAAQRAYMQRGEHAAHRHWSDQLLRDRSKLMPFQLITFDDVRFDLRVIMPSGEVVYPEALFALDVATGVILAKGILGTYTREQDGDGGKAGCKRNFQQADMRFLMHHILERYGLPQDWQMRVLHENASASFHKADRDMFAQLAGIEFQATQVIRNKLSQHGFVEQGGAPWQKGWIEALFRLVHTRTNHLPGTVGRRYDLTPGEMGDASKSGSTEHYVVKTIKEAMAKGIPTSELQLPLLTLDQFHDLLENFVMLLNWRTNHKLQGFDKVFEFQLNGDTIRHDDPRASQWVSAGAKAASRMEAPMERFQRLLRGHQFSPAHPHLLWPLALDKREITVRAEKVSIQDRNHSNDAMVFRDEAAAQALAEWNGKEKALIGFLSPEAECIHLFSNDEHLTYIASPSRVGRVDMTDDKALLARSGEVHRARDQVRRHTADTIAPKDHRYKAMREHNDLILDTSRHEDRAADVSLAMAKAEDRLTHKKQVHSLTSEQWNANDLLPAEDEQETGEKPVRNTSASFDPADLL